MPPQDIDGLRRIIETLGESEKRYHVLFEQLPYGVLLIDDKGQIVEFNEAAHMQLGYSRSEFERLTLADLDPMESPDEIREKMVKILKDGVADHYVKHRTKHGEIRDVHVISQTIVLSGRVYFHAIWVDITDQKRMERTHRESEEKFRTLFESAADGIMIISLEGRILDMNSVVFERLGYTRQEMFGMHVSEIDSPEFAPRVPERLAEIRARGKAIFEIAHLRKDGTALPVEVNARVTEIAGEKVLLSIVRDISDRKRMERAQRESEEKFRTLFEGASDAIWILSMDCRLIDMNNIAHERLGYTKAEMLGMHIADIDSPEFASLVPERLKMIRAEGNAIFESAHIRKDGTTLPVEVNVRLAELGGERVIMSIERDISERKLMERRQRESEEKFRTLFESASDGILIISLDGRIIDMNSTAHERLGYTKQELVGATIAKINPPEFASLVPERMKLIQTEGKAIFESAQIKKDGTIFPVEVNVRVTEIADEKVLLSIARDITERKRMERTLKDSEEKFRTLFESASDGIIIMSLDGRFLEMNTAAHERLGYTKQEMLGLHITDIDAPEFASGVPERMAAIRKHGKAIFESAHVRKDGTIMPVEVSVRLTELGGERVLLSIARDITERKRAEHAIKRSETSLAASQRIAHIGSWDWDIETNKVHWSDEFYRIYGYQPGEVEPDYALVLNALTPESMEGFLAAIDDSLKGVRPFEIDYGFFRRDGSAAVMHTIGEVLRDSSGTARRMVGTGQDVTERRHAEAILRDSEEKFRTIFDSVNDGIGIVDLSYRRFIAANRTICGMLGYTKEEFAGLCVEDIHPRDALPHVLEEFEKQARGEIIIAADLPVLRKDGSVFYADVGTAQLTLGGRQCLLGVFRDTTERTRAMEALRQSEDRFQMAMRGANDGLFDWDMKTNEVYYSPRWKSMLGYAEDELEGNLETWSRLIHPDDLAPTLAHVRDTDEGRTNTYRAEFRMRHKEGHYIDILARAYPVRGPGGETLRMVGTHVDITERKRMEAALSEVLDLNQKVTNESVAGIVAFRAESGECVLCNKALARITGGTVGQLMRGNFRELKSWRESGLYDAAIKALASDEPVRQEIFIKTTFGHEAWMDSVFTKFTSSGEQHLLLIVDDITERKRMEDEITETNRLLQSLMQAIPDMVFYRDASGRFVMANRMTAISMGRPVEDIIGKTNYDLSPRETADMCALSDEASIRSGRPEHSEEHYTGPDGQTVYLDTIKTCIYDEEGRYTGLLAISRDITERKLMEEELRKSLTERETLLRELYHRTKNNMNVIRSLINLQTSSLVADERIHQMFRDLQNRIMSMSLVHERLYRSQDLSHVRLRDYLGDLTDAMLRAYKVRPGSVAVKLDIGDFELSIDTLLPCGLVINELMSNSFKYAFADGRGGEITISGRISHDGEIRLEYADNGVGFPEGFNTDSTSTLGLKLIKGLMTSQLRGKVEITSGPSPSFTFTFREPEYEKRL